MAAVSSALCTFNGFTHVAEIDTLTIASSCHGSSLSKADRPSVRARTIARRSHSIFSRQGSVYYDQMPQHITAVVRTTPATRKSAGVRKNVKRRPSKRVSILQALPPADTISPTSPAIVKTQPLLSSIIEKRPPLERLYPSSECLPLSAVALERSVPSPSTPRAKEDSKTRIGAWREGVAISNINGARKTSGQKKNNQEAQPADWPLPASEPVHKSRRSSKPTLSVVIPDSWSPKTKTLTKQICEDLAATATTPAVSKFNMTAHILPSACIEQRNKLGFTTPLADFDGEEVPMTAPPAISQRDFAPDAVTPPERFNPSRNSSNASTDPSYIDSDGSNYSRKSSKSSRTSMDSSDDSRPKTPRPAWKGTRKGRKPMKAAFAVMDPAKAGVFDSPNPDLNKPLPPSPGPEPSVFDPSRSWTSLPRNSPKPSSISSATPESIQSARIQHGWGNFQRPYMRPTAPIDWKPVRVKTSKSCKSLHKLDMFDNEFMKTDPYVSSTPTSPTLSDATSELKDTLCEIKPLQIRRKSRPGMKRSVSSESVLPATEDDFGLPNIKVTRTGSASSEVSTVPSIPPKSTLRSGRRASELSDTIMTPTSPSSRRLSGSNWSRKSSEAKLKVSTDKANRRRSGSDFKDTLTPLRIHHISTPVTARLIGSGAPQLPVFSPIPRLLSPRTPSARISILIPTTLDEENTTSLTGLDEAWRPTSPMKFQTARAAAENALLRIMSSLDSFDDLANTAVINKGMRRVYKQNELSLLKSVLRNESIAAWELREWSPPPSPESSAVDPDIMETTYTAITYKSHAMRDRGVLASLKPMIVERCESFLRPETVAALSNKDDPNAARFEEAFYRVWCFCRIFGSGKNREEDITGQIDWLKGGVLAHAQGCAATVNTNLEFDMSSVLLNPPDYFGLCNSGGLSADELYDMTELWNCLAALLQDYVGKTSQARTHGIFNSSSIKRGDTETEALVLEEWIFHILTLGPQAVLKLAELAPSTNSGFALAALNGWMDWTAPSFNSSRGTFLREPLCRLYEERITAVPQPSTLTPKDQERKELSRKRVATLAAEIRAARCSSSYKRLPLIDMATERPMSLFSRMTENSRRASMASSITLVGRTPVSATPTTAFPASPGMPGSSASSSSNAARVAAWTKKVSPIAEEEAQRQLSPAALSQLGQYQLGQKQLSPTGDVRAQRRQSEWVPRQRMERPDPPPRLRTNSADIAIQNVVALGFTPNQAREALRVTDSGDGLHVDRAVDWLLRHSP
ncbi:UBA/TS-N domain-containing protein 1 [Elsinoe australis]|uniref:UBA/TS-N domain-containing protein 1 n=1 Tax=Elsinoe australis TaxID=40998 RepID=A0A4U7ASJ8_9PEZI|nr:UBA/TS-N domain-containing protein 1 [Elsinoe australis]